MPQVIHAPHHEDGVTDVWADPPDTKGIHHWESPSEVPKGLEKYWYQRHQIFSEYDRGIWMTDDAWYAVTPEAIANKIAIHISEAVPNEKRILIDAFSGYGGNAIAFARQGRWDQIFAIERDPKAMECAKQNAKVYGVEKKIFWILGDCFSEMKKRFTDQKDAVIFASPPWGGPDYSDTNVFDLSTMQPYNLDTIYNNFAKTTETMVLYLPRTSDLNQLAKYVPEEKKLDVAHYCIKGSSKAICAYFGEFNFEA